MPEHAEVAIIIDQLNKNFANSSLREVEIVGGKFLKTGIEGLGTVQFPLNKVQFHCHGKFIYWTFSEQPVVFNHLGMAAGFGQRSKHSAIRFRFDNTDVYFNDIRHFGNFKFASKNDLQLKLNTLGWNPIDPLPVDFISRLRKYNHKTIAEILLNQSIISGTGNYLKSEICYASKIHPLRTVGSLSDSEILELCNNTTKIIKEAYRAGGATIATFQDLNGNSGKFYNQFKVYSRKTDPNGYSVIKTTTPDKRSTYFVKEIQK